MAGTIQEAAQLSPHTQDTIDSEVRRIITGQYERAQRILTEHRAALATLTERLLKTETLDGSVVRQAVEGSRLAAAS